MPKAKRFNTLASVEAASRIADGNAQLSLQQIDERLRALGYRLDRSSRCAGIARYMTGPNEGRTYPNVDYDVIQISDGKSAYHFESRNDANFRALQSLRQEVFALVRGVIHGI